MATKSPDMTVLEPGRPGVFLRCPRRRARSAFQRERARRVGETPFLTRPRCGEREGQGQNAPALWQFRGRNEKGGATTRERASSRTCSRMRGWRLRYEVARQKFRLADVNAAAGTGIAVPWVVHDRRPQAAGLAALSLATPRPVGVRSGDRRLSRLGSSAAHLPSALA